ncbi:MAG TPA: hypothetical protein VFV75_14195 [Candidatus Polarisedimenticolaceae bacterium]|nr:hypothetical protein [Candidatus Polarisedimenticolaceae bacterium]
MRKARTALAGVVLLGATITLAGAATAGRAKAPPPTTRLADRPTAVRGGKTTGGAGPRTLGRRTTPGSYRGDGFRSGIAPPPFTNWRDESAGDFPTPMPIATRSAPGVGHDDAMECVPR